MAPLALEMPSSDKVLYVFYDFETTQDTPFSEAATIHVPNLVCVQQFCTLCDEIPDIETDCERCGKRKHTFWEEDPVGDLLSYLCRPRPWANKIIAIAHNAKAFDLHFILNRAILLEWRPELIMNGQKIVCMKMEHLVFLDSVSFLPCALRKMSEAFGLTASKSWYPHYFNTKENMHYVGEMPDISFYGADAMSESERREFMEWYQSQRGKEVFDNRRVLEEYCQADVTVLRQACQVFRREFIQIGNIEVFLESITIASACNKVLRRRFLEPNTIGLIPAGGYTGNVNYSTKAIMWLIYKEQTDGCTILHGRNGREYRLPDPSLHRFSVDGYCPDTRKVYEFCGCYFHGHSCMPYRDIPTLRGDTLAQRYEQTMARLEQITQAGYQVEMQWECEFDKDILPLHPELKVHPLILQAPLNTRDALYGGRTEAMYLYYKIKEGETIQYCDIMSLYPYICKYFKFPVGHPTVHAGDACRDIDAMLQKEGLIKCKILPPKDLYHPVLPFRCNKKLLFCLCHTCAVDLNTSAECTHTSVAERALTGTWVMDEVRLAVQKGYQVIEVFEVYEYNVTQYDRQNGEGGLFVDYINTFLKLKAEASGFPAWVRTPDDEDRYINTFFESEGVRMDREAIRPNSAKRGIAKLCLNSMWGKLTERNNRTQTKMITEPRELYRFLATPGIEVTNMLFLSNDVVWATWRHIDDEVIPSLCHTNEVIGAYVTAGARIHLYTYLDRLQERALYCDTDSVFFVQKDDEPALIPRGDQLGAMVNELRPGEYITEFTSGGPKNYAYRVLDTSTGQYTTVCKVRGITLNYDAKHLVNFDVIKDMILKPGPPPPPVVMVHTAKKIKRKRDKNGGPIHIITEPEDKMYRVCFTKRRRLNDNSSVPLGYINRVEALVRDQS
jgi:G:T-mismatch repair DNA endonuclease (very short patch repair protein)